ncbi:MAG: hypothetical protein P4L82_12200 [Ancalomicrobiaceae bacterium]|nr:hypothetical protein [Ancalomicrobiaceae bacterium]
MADIFADVHVIADLAAVVIALCTAGGVLVGYGRLQANISTTSGVAKGAEEKADDVAAGLASFRVEAERRFVSSEIMEKTEARIVAAIDRLGDRIDNLVDHPSRHSREPLG